MPTLNVRLAAIIFVVVVVVGGGVHLLHGFQVGRQATALKTASEHAEDDKNLEEAIRLLHNYVVLAPMDHAAELHLGMLYAEARSFSSAYSFLEEGLRQADSSTSDEDLRKARRKLVDVAIVLRRYSDAKAHLDKLLDGAVDKNKERRTRGEPPQGDPELLDLYGQVLTFIGKDQEARDVLQDAITIAPNQINSYVNLSFVLRARLSQAADADAVIESMLKNNVKSVAALEKYAYYYLEQKKFDVALKKSEAALELAPDDPRALLLVAQCHMAKGEYEKAIEFLRKCIKVKKEDRAAYMELARCLNNLGKPKEAIDVMGNGSQEVSGPKRLELVWELANMQIYAGQIDEARKNVAELRQGGYHAEMVDFLDARIAIQQQDWIKAERLLRENVLPKIVGNPGVLRLAWVYLSECYRQQGSEPKQILALQRALDIDKYFFQARATLAEIYMSHQQLELALEEYIEAGKGPQKTDAMINAVRVSIMLQLRREPEKRDWQAVDDMIGKLRERMALNAALVVLNAEVLLAKDQSKDLSQEATEAEKILRDCTIKLPKVAECWLALIKLDMHRASKATDPLAKAQLWKKASDDIDSAEKNLGDRVAVRMARGILAVRSKESRGKDPQTSETLKRLGENTGGLTDAEKSQLWSVLGTLAVEADDLDLGRAYCRLIAAREPKNVHIRYLLCELNLHAYENGGVADTQELDRLVDEIERLGGQGPYWLYAKAIRALVQSKSKDPQLLVEARGYLHDALEMRKDWSALAVLSGKIRELQEAPDEALNFYLRAIHFMNEHDSDVIASTVRLLVPRGRIDEAKMLFDFLEKQKSPLLSEMQGDLRQDYLVVQVFRGDPIEAEKAVDNFVATTSTNSKDLNWQGEMYWYLTRRAKAAAQQRQTHNPAESWQKDAAMLRVAQKGVNSLMRAQKLNPQDDEAYVGLVRLLYEVGQATRAKPLIVQAEHSLKSDKALVTIGYCYELMNDLPKAQEKYEAAVKAAPENSRVLRKLTAFYISHGQAAAAEPLLRKIISLQNPAAVVDISWVRRVLAQVLAGRGNFDELCKAVDLLDENLKGKMATSDDRRLKAQLLLKDPRKEKIDDAIAAMEDLVRAPDATAEDNFELARLYLKKHKTSEFENQMHVVLGSKQPRYLMFYTTLLLERNNFADAEQELQTLEKVAPNSFDTLRMRTEYLVRRGEFKAAFDLAVGYLDPPDPKNRGMQIYNVAAIVEAIAIRAKAGNQQTLAAGFAAKADELYSALRNKRLATDGDFAYASYLARQKRIGESLEVLQQSLDSPNLAPLQKSAASIIASRAATPAQLDQLEKILVASAAKTGRSTNLLLLLAVLNENQRKYDKAREFYREVLAKEPRNFQALNNLSLDMARNGENLDEALGLVNQALAVSGPMPDVLDSRAVIHLIRQEPAKALEDLNEAIGDGVGAELYFHKAWALSLLDRKPEAAEAFTEARNKGLDVKLIAPQEVAVYDRLKNMQ